MTSDDLSLSRRFQEAKLFCSTSKDVENYLSADPLVDLPQTNNY